MVRKISAVSLAMALAACGREQQKTAALPDDLQKDLAAVSAGGDLATAPTSYQRMRFVSAIERSKPVMPAKRPTVTHQRARAATTHHQPNPQPTAADVVEETTVAEAPAPVTTQEAPSPEPAATVAPAPAPAPSSAPAGSASGGDMGGRDQGGGIGAVLGGILGAVIRGGRVGVDKCDPRTDGRAGAPVIDRPVFGSPLPTGQPTFPGGIRRR